VLIQRIRIYKRSSARSAEKFGFERGRQRQA
jgi:hypothetical protein